MRHEISKKIGTFKAPETFSHGRCEFHKTQDGEWLPYWKNKNCYNFAAILDIFNKFDVQGGLIISSE